MSDWNETIQRMNEQELQPTEGEGMLSKCPGCGAEPIKWEGDVSSHESIFWQRFGCGTDTHLEEDGERYLDISKECLRNQLKARDERIAYLEKSLKDSESVLHGVIVSAERISPGNVAHRRGTIIALCKNQLTLNEDLKKESEQRATDKHIPD
jgi:hypothetical protein